MKNDSGSSGPLLHPRYWPTWMLLGVVWCIVQLPYRWQIKLGSMLGRLLMRVMSRRRHIANVNLRLCFPELGDRERTALLQRHFESLGMGLLEIALGWWVPLQRLRPLVQVEGIEYLLEAVRRKKGVLLCVGHFTSLELGGRLLAAQAKVAGHAIYRSHENPVLEQMVQRARKKYCEKTIRRNDIRGILTSLKGNKVVFYLPDQNYGLGRSTFAPFFGQPAATTTAASRIARITGSAVVPFFPQRLENGRGYLLTIFPPLHNFPSEDIDQDTARINKVIEQQARQAPEQYLWIHRRFKDRPLGWPSVY